MTSGSPSAVSAVISNTKIGLFGGAFDPPHNAHLALAQVAISALGLTELRVVPTGHAWHKTRTLSPANQRLAMTHLAFDDMPGVVVDDRELQRPGPTFTIDTLEALQRENPSAQLYLIMGADQFAAFKQWHRWQAILELAIICIAQRASNTPASGQFDAFSGFADRFLTLSMPLMPVSATQIRQLLAGSGSQAPDLHNLLPEAVARYIASHKMYRLPT